MTAHPHTSVSASARPAGAAAVTSAAPGAARPAAWSGFTAAEAAAWSRSLTRFRLVPVTVGELARQTGHASTHGAVDEAGWPERAAAARAIGFAPESFDAWRCSLDRVPSSLYAAHPWNHAVEWPGHQPGHPFDTRVWAGWTSLFESGLEPDTATHFALAHAEASGFASGDRIEYRAGRQFARGYQDALEKRCRAYGLTGEALQHCVGTQDSRLHDRLLRQHREDRPAFRERSIAARAAAEDARSSSAIAEGFARARERYGVDS